MNILISDSWLREHLKTKATPGDIKKYLSLCGPSVERVNTIGNETVYDIEVTTNRVDMMSVRGIAREASVILPEFGIPAELLPMKTAAVPREGKPLGITIRMEYPEITTRVLAVCLDTITIKPSSPTIAKRLEQIGERPINNAIDITNYVMQEVGHPIHAFDYDRLTERCIRIRKAKKGELFTTLDGKNHTTLGGEIVFDNGKGTIIDLPAIMGCENTCVTEQTKRVLLWAECIDPISVRTTSMSLSIRSKAATINEKYPDPELAYTAITRAVALYKKETGARIASAVTDIYPAKETAHLIILSHERLERYLGTHIQQDRVMSILTRLGCAVTVRKKPTVAYTITPPSWRIHDMHIEEDAIEEVARIYGYHTIPPVLPATSAVPVPPDPLFSWERECKTRLRDWGYTEFYTYSMISGTLLSSYGFDPSAAYRITNPLLTEHEYLRPSLIPSILETLAANVKFRAGMQVFELANIYGFRKGNLPLEKRMLVLASTGDSYRQIKGVAETLLSLFNISLPETPDPAVNTLFDRRRSLALGRYGSIGFIDPSYVEIAGMKGDVVAAELDFEALVSAGSAKRTFTPIPKYPPVIEDLSFVIEPPFAIGPFLASLRAIDPLIRSVEFLDAYKRTRTIRVVYSNPNGNLTVDDIAPIRMTLIETAKRMYRAELRTS